MFRLDRSNLRGLRSAQDDTLEPGLVADRLRPVAWPLSSLQHHHVFGSAPERHGLFLAVTGHDLRVEIEDLELGASHVELVLGHFPEVQRVVQRTAEGVDAVRRRRTDVEHLRRMDSTTSSPTRTG